MKYMYKFLNKHQLLCVNLFINKAYKERVQSAKSQKQTERERVNTSYNLLAAFS